MDKQRVNTITSTFDKSFDGVTLTMYRTHKVLGKVTNEQIGVPAFTGSNAKSKTTYGEYCKETLINLLENGGIEGYYYERGQVGGVSTKYDVQGFTKASEDILVSTLMGFKGIDALTPLRVYSCEVDVRDRYADGFIKSALAHLKVSINKSGIEVLVEIKSGQLCKPRRFVHHILGGAPMTETGISKLIAVM